MLSGQLKETFILNGDDRVVYNNYTIIYKNYKFVHRVWFSSQFLWHVRCRPTCVGILRRYSNFPSLALSVYYEFDNLEIFQLKIYWNLYTIYVAAVKYVWREALIRHQSGDFICHRILKCQRIEWLEIIAGVIKCYLERNRRSVECQELEMTE